jgi:hypothetical protein
LDDPVRRAKAREERLTINNETPYINEVFNDLLTGPLSNEAELDASRNHPDTLDRIGVTETVELLVGTFIIIANAQFEQWTKQQKPYEGFVALLEPIRLSAIEGCRAVWPGRVVADPTWFDRMILPKAAEQLESAWPEWRRKARAAEQARLETSAPKAATHTVNEFATGVSPNRITSSVEAPPEEEYDKTERGQMELRIQEAATSEDELLAPFAAGEKPGFPERAQWLNDRVQERGWNEYALYQHGGPDPKTTKRVLAGKKVYPSRLKKIADGLNNCRENGKRKFPELKLSDIPSN